MSYWPRSSRSPAWSPSRKMDEPIIRPYVPPGMEDMTNEALCELAQRGDEDAANVLIWRNEMFLVQIAGELHRTLFTHSHDFSVDIKDLLQVARLAFWKAIETFDPSRGAKLSTYARTVIWNKILDYKERYDVETEFEQELVSRWQGKKEDDEDFSGKENHFGVKANRKKSKLIRPPEALLIREETKVELARSVSSLSPRERVYLCYRFGYPEDEERSLKQTAEHFSIRVIRAEKIETASLAALRKALPWGSDVSEAYCTQSGIRLRATIPNTVSF